MKRRMVMAAVAAWGFSSAMARADILTYDLAGTVSLPTLPAFSGTYDLVVSLDTTESTTFSIPTYSIYDFALTIKSFTINGAPVSDPDYKQVYTQTQQQNVAQFTAQFLDQPTVVSFIFSTPLIAGDLSHVVPLSDLTGSFYVDNSQGSPLEATGDATLTVIPEPSGLLALLPAMAVTGWLSCRRRRRAAPGAVA